MTLKFSYTGWARVLSRLLGGFETAGFIHRVGGDRSCSALRAPTSCDLCAQAPAGHGGSFGSCCSAPTRMLLDLTRPAGVHRQPSSGSSGAGRARSYGRWTYWEKFDYFAVFWGVVVIGSTGLMLWFPEFFTRFLPGWLINVATIIHSDEALLAVGFIFTVHFFNTHFRPEKFPMDTVIFTGRDAARGVQARQAARVRGAGGERASSRSTWSSRTRRS